MSTANMTLSALALRDGDKKKAVEYLREERRRRQPLKNSHIRTTLCRDGTSFEISSLRASVQAVIDFLERMARTNLAERIDLREAAAALRRGETPRRFRASARAVTAAANDSPRIAAAFTTRGNVAT
jgi:hypothetical protein